jgi:hypothetical protein
MQPYYPLAIPAFSDDHLSLVPQHPYDGNHTEASQSFLDPACPSAYNPHVDHAPASTSTSHHPASPSLGVPTLQVIQPTPTKDKTRQDPRGRNSCETSPIPTRQTLGVTVVDAQNAPRLGKGKGKKRASPSAEDLQSETEEQRLERERKAERTRENGRLRQQRKRDKDKGLGIVGHCWPLPVSKLTDRLPRNLDRLQRGNTNRLSHRPKRPVS